MIRENKKVRALVLLSGGLDSILAVRLLLEQGIEVQTVNFRTNFCGPSKARPAAKILGVPLREVNIRQDFLAVLKKPKYGYGAGMNPCIDCHALMLKKAAEIMRVEGFDFVATGEVLGERPMSQHLAALKIVEKEAGLEGYLLRPLSAKLLEPTVPEKDGRVDREKLGGISGRSRKIQMELAAQFGITEYPTPAGGCALTQEGFAGRLKELMTHKPDFTPGDVDLIRFGRHFWVEVSRNGINPPPNPPPLKKGEGGAERETVQIILGRNQQENEILEAVAKTDDILIAPENFVGAMALVRPVRNKDSNGARGREITEEIIEKTKNLILQFAPKAKNINIEKLTFLTRSGNK